MVQVPDIKPWFGSGAIDLSQLVLVQKFFEIESSFLKMSGESKLQLLIELRGQTYQETLRLLAERSSLPEKLVRPDYVEPLKNHLNEVRLTLSDEDLKRIEELRSVLAHQKPFASLSEIVSFALAQANAKTKTKTKTNKKTHKRTNTNTKTKPQQSGHVAGFDFGDENVRVPNASLKRAVFGRANGKCEMCESTHAIEYDHKIAWAVGGRTTFENMRLLCRNCNLREAFLSFG